MPARKTEETIEIQPIERRSIELAILGQTPLIHNRLSQKAQHELLLPAGRKTAADRAASLKHNPLEEFRASPYLLPESQPTAVGIMASGFKGAMMTAALDLPGTAKAKIGRLVWVSGDFVPVFGVPELFMSIVRSADINKTPDVRTRAIMPRWAARVTISFAVPLLNERSLINLLAAAGMVAGVGDYRPEKGKGDYGQFQIVDPDDAEFLEIVANGGRMAQAAALKEPGFYDLESEELFGWFVGEAGRRGKLQAVA